MLIIEITETPFSWHLMKELLLKSILHVNKSVIPAFEMNFTWIKDLSFFLKE